MASKEKTLIKNTLLFSVGNAGSKLLMLIMVPLYTYFVTVEQMGQYDVVHTYVGLFAPFSCLAINEGIYRWLLNEDQKNDENVLRSGLTVSALFVAIFDVLAAILLVLIHYQYTVEFILLVTTQSIYTLAQFITRGLRNNKIYAFQGIVYVVALVICNLIMVIWLKWQARGLLYSMIIAFIVTTLYMCIVQHLVTNYIIKGKHDKELVKDLIKYSLPMVPNNVAWWLVSASNRVVINWSIGDAANGIYAVAMKFPTLVNMLSTFFYQAWQEQAITEYSNEERDAYYTKVFRFYSKLLLSGIVLLFPVTKFIIIYFMDPSYHDAYLYVGFLYLSGVFNAFSAFYGTGYLSTKKTGGAFTTTVIGAIANVAITFVLIYLIGLYAAVIGSMVANLIIWVLRIIQTRKYFHIKLDILSLVSMIALNAVGIVILTFSNLPMLLITQVIYGGIFLFVNKDMILKVVGKFIKIEKRS